MRKFFASIVLVLLLAFPSWGANHWSHITTWRTDFYIHWLNIGLRAAEYDWVAAHYDYVMGGTTNEHKSRNANLKQYPYILNMSLIQPGEENEDIYICYNDHMAAWYALHEEYDIEDAFLHNQSDSERVVFTLWGSLRYVINPKDPGAIAYQTARINEICTTAIGGYYPDGVFVDEHATGNTGVIFAGSEDYIEYHSSGNTAAQRIAYQHDETTLIAAIKTVVGSNKRLLINTNFYVTQDNIDWIFAGGGTHLEAMNSCATPFVDNDYYGFIDTLLAQDVLIDFSGQPWGENCSGMTQGNSDSVTHRHDLWKLASYYTVVDSTATKLAFSVNDWVYPEADRWIEAIETNVGHPTQARQSYQTGTDGTGEGYVVYSRNFDNALILNRPKWHYHSTVYDDTTSVAVALPEGTWYPLSSDGTLSGTPITTINLRNAEGAILMKTGGGVAAGSAKLGAGGTLTFGSGGSIII